MKFRTTKRFRLHGCWIFSMNRRWWMAAAHLTHCNDWLALSTGKLTTCRPKLLNTTPPTPWASSGFSCQETLPATRTVRMCNVCSTSILGARSCEMTTNKQARTSALKACRETLSIKPTRFLLQVILQAIRPQGKASTTAKMNQGPLRPGI